MEITSESNCPSDFKATHSHVFFTLTSNDDNLIFEGKCVIRASNTNDELIVLDNGRIQSVVQENAVGNSNRNFQAVDVGSDRVSILNFRENKYLKSEESTLRATGTLECGEDCHFILENINIEASRNKKGEQINYFQYVRYL